MIESDVLVLLLTVGVLSRPWCILELYTALTNDVPIVLLEVCNSFPFLFDEAQIYLNNFAEAAEATNPEIRLLLSQHNLTLRQVGKVLIDGIFRPGQLRSTFTPNASQHVLDAELEHLRMNMETARRKSQMESRRSVKTFESQVAYLMEEQMDFDMQPKNNKTAACKKSPQIPKILPLLEQKGSGPRILPDRGSESGDEELGHFSRASLGGWIV